MTLGQNIVATQMNFGSLAGGLKLFQVAVAELLLFVALVADVWAFVIRLGTGGGVWAAVSSAAFADICAMNSWLNLRVLLERERNLNEQK
jgi:hypothetical protein